MSALHRILQVTPWVLGGLLLLSGCETDGGARRPRALALSVDPNGLVTGTGFDASDLAVACGAVQRGLGSVPEIAMARRAVRIVVEPVVNDSRFAVNVPVFNTSVRNQLEAWAQRTWRFVAAEDPAVATDYFLAGRLQHLKPLEPIDHVILLYSVQLIDARTSEIVWAGTAELKNRSFHEPTPH